MSECPSELELDRAISVGADPQLAAHLERCETCRTTWDQTRRAIELARELPLALPPAHHRQDQRAALLATWDAGSNVEADKPAATRPRWIVPALALAVAASIVIVVAPWETQAPPTATVTPPRGLVHPHDGARFTLTSQPPDEMVRLRDGVIDIDVDVLAPGERFRVVVGADQIEVRGTSFQVVASADQLTAVRVVHGRVEVRRANEPVLVLDAGDTWRAPVIAGVPPPPPPPPPARSVARTPRPPIHPIPPAPLPPSTTDPQEVAFVRGWDAMRQGELEHAASAFRRAILLAPDGALVEDATFWHAVAIARLHRSSEAIVAFRGFLDAYPKSTRVGEASAMLGWLLVDRNELDEARRRFEVAIDDPHPSAQASARQGLEVLNKGK